MVVRPLKSIYIALFMGLMVNSAHGIFTALHYWVSPEGTSEVFCLADDHTPCTKPIINCQQRNAVVTQAVKRGALVIAEDAGHYAGKNSTIQGWTQNITLKYKRDVSPMVGLINDCIKNDIEWISVEFRYPAIILDTLFEMIKHGVQLDSAMQPANVAKQMDFKTYIKTMQERVTTWQKTDKQWTYLNNYYAEQLKEYAKSAQKFTDSIQLEQMKVDQTFNNQLLLAGKELLDAAIVHALYENRHEPTIFICAGAWHIQNVNRVLRNLGYTKRVLSGFCIRPIEYVEKDTDGKNAKHDDKQKRDKEVLIKETCAIDIEKCFAAVDEFKRRRWFTIKNALILGTAVCCAWLLYYFRDSFNVINGR